MRPQTCPVLIAGATGLVGRECLAQLHEDPRVTQIVSLQRRAMPSRDRLHVLQVDFERLEESLPLPFAPQVAICALGTTIRQAGSPEAFRRVDHDHVLAVARVAKAAGVRSFGLVSALGADPQARVFYNRVKGETERDLVAMGFDSLTLVRPSLLLGAREEFRLGERLAAPFMYWLPRAWRAVPAADVARVLVAATLRGEPGIEHIENAALFAATPRAAG